MKSLLLLLLVVAVSCKSPFFSQESYEEDSSEHGGPPGKRRTSCDCGWSNKPSKRVTGGVETGVNEYPFVALLVDRLRRPVCGGTILTPLHVITAAHCTDDFVRRGLWMSIVLGEHDTSRHDETTATQLINVKKIYQHNYNSKTIVNDIALILLEREIKFSKYVGPACMPTQPPNLDGKYLKLIGWGKLSDTGVASETLQEANLRVVPLKECATMYSILNPDDKNQICTHGDARGACKGDSGGPLVWLDPETNRYTLSGIVSYGRVCGSENPNVYTEPWAYSQWIQEKIKESTPAGKDIHTCSKV